MITWHQGTIGSGNMVLAPWSNTGGGIRITNAGVVTIPATTVSSSKTTGALVVTGGVGVGNKLYVGDEIRTGADTNAQIVLSADSAGPGLEIGLPGRSVSGTPYLDFHVVGNSIVRDYDARIYADLSNLTPVGIGTSDIVVVANSLIIKRPIAFVDNKEGGQIVLCKGSDNTPFWTLDSYRNESNIEYVRLVNMTDPVIATADRFALDQDGNLAVKGNLTAYAASTYSDIRLKENIESLQNSLDKVCKLNGYNFNYIGRSAKLVGLIAQEVEAVIPELVSEYTDPQDNTYKTVHYSNMAAIFVEAIKELTNRISIMEKEIQELKNR